MPLFHYQSLDPQGKKHTSILEAATIEEAKEKLRNQKLFVISLYEHGKKRSFPFFARKADQIKGDHLVTFTHQLSQLLSARIPLYESLLSMEEQYRKEKFHRIIVSLCEQVKSGVALSEALKGFPYTFSTLYTSLVAAGESVGNIGDALEKIASILSKQSKLKKQLTTSLLYPLILGCFACVVILILLTFVIPSLEAIFADRNVNRFTSFVIGFSHFVTEGYPYYIPAILLSVFGIGYYFTTSRGKSAWEKFTLKVPFVKGVMIQVALARFSRTLSTLLAGGVRIIPALQISRRVMRQPLLEAEIEQAEKRIIEGSFLSKELARSKYIPALFSTMIAIGEESGEMGSMLQKIADLYEEEVEKNLHRLTQLAQPIILLVMGAIVGVIMLAVLIPLTDVSSFL